MHSTLLIAPFFGNASQRSYVDLLSLPTNHDDSSACLDSRNSDCLCRILDEWPASRSQPSTGAQKTPFYWEPSLNAQYTRLGDVCEVGKRTQSVISPSYNIQLIPYADSDIIHVNALGTSMVILNSYKVATDLLEERSINYSSR